MSDNTSRANTFVYTTYIASNREAVWTALTSSEFTTKYWNGRIVESSWHVGAPITVRHDYDDKIDFVGAILEAQRPRRLSYEMTQDGDGTTRATRVTFELIGQGDVVALTITHEGLTDDAYRSSGAGWSFILSNLKTLLESGKPLAMPEEVLAAYR
jgi:uncharacterized protein YndB with AHSA1/START domain